jgi:hypothetical protein
VGGGGGTGAPGSPLTPLQQLCGAMSVAQCLLLAPTPSAVQEILKSIGVYISGTIGAIVTILVNPKPMGNGTFPSVEWVEANCTQVGQPVKEPSINYPGGESIEQSLCARMAALHHSHACNQNRSAQGKTLAAREAEIWSKASLDYVNCHSCPRQV